MSLISRLFKGKAHGTKLAAFALAACMMCTPITAAASSYDDDIQNELNKKDEIKGEINAIAGMVSDKQDQLSNTASEIAQLEKDRLSIMTEEDIAIAELTFLKQSIEESETNLAEMTDSVAELERRFVERAKVMYQNSEVDFIALFFESNNIFDFIDRVAIYKKVLEEDTALINQLKADKVQLELKRDQQERLFKNKEVLLAEIESAIADLESKTSIAEGKYSNLATLLDDLAAEEERLNQNLSNVNNNIADLENKKEEERLEQERLEQERLEQERLEQERLEQERLEQERLEQERLEQERLEQEKLEQEKPKPGDNKPKPGKPTSDKNESNKNESNTSESDKNEQTNNSQNSTASRDEIVSNFCWPVADYYGITSPFGYRTHPINGKWSLHTGVDLGSQGGTKIFAAQSGVVVESTTNGGGYGYYIKIDHGNGVETLYAHCSALYVKVGQTVQRGQVIAAVGRTGAATGNHLHFEVILNGTHVQPLDYISDGKH